MNTVAGVTLAGIGATALVDLWALVRRALFRVPFPDYALVGRWIAYLPRGRVIHRPIAATPAARGERAIGWTTHYLTGIAFAGLLVAICGREWIRHPTLAPAVLFGISTVVAPFLLMQPGMGAGVAASRTRQPGAVRVQSLINHAFFGLGLYAAARIVSVSYG